MNVENDIFTVTSTQGINVSDSLFLISTAKRSLENAVVDVHVRKDGCDS